MKRIKVLFLSFLSTISCSFGLLSENAIATKADNINDTVYLGKMAQIEFVSEEAKVYIDRSEVEYIESFGRRVYSEYSQLGPGSMQSLSVDSPNLYVLRYYYWANPTCPIITGDIDMYNTYTSLVNAVSYLEDIADFRISQGEMTSQDKYNAIVGYIRCFRSGYYERIIHYINAWEMMAGPLNTSFATFVNSIHPGGLTIKEYFAAFTKKSGYNNNNYDSDDVCHSSDYFLNGCHGNKIQRFNDDDTTNDGELFMVDPISNSACIDLIHMFASIDGIMSNTEETLDLPGSRNPLWVAKLDYQLITGFGGDLQSEALRLENFNVSDYDFMTITVNDWGNSLMPLPDILADMDAQNIGYNFNSANTTISLSSKIYGYYRLSVHTRKSLFVAKVSSMWNGTSGSSGFESAVKYMLKLNDDGTARDTIVADFKWNIIYGLMDYDMFTTQVGVSLNIRNLIANSFINYCLS